MNTAGHIAAGAILIMFVVAGYMIVKNQMEKNAPACMG